MPKKSKPKQTIDTSKFPYDLDELTKYIQEKATMDEVMYIWDHYGRPDDGYYEHSVGMSCWYRKTILEGKEWPPKDE